MINQIFKNKVLKLLANIEYGSIQLNDGPSQYKFVGTKDIENKVDVTIYDPSVYKSFVLMGTNGVSNSYINKEWDCSNLLSLLDLMLKNKTLFEKIDNGFARLNVLKDTITEFLSPRTLQKAKKNILYHYDLGNNFFKQFLDSKMMYSCAIFESDDVSLNEAAELKLKRICEKLKLSEKDHLLEIGTGWGGLAIYAHQHYGCKVTTTTISDAQFQYVHKTIEDMNLTKDITVLNKDFRELKGVYNKIVSVEMIEAVGFKLFADYFTKVNDLLSPNGLFLLQSITINDADYDRAKLEIDFIKKFIFPGGCLPSVSIIKAITSKHTQLKLCEIEEIGLHYVTTLAQWKHNFRKNINTFFEMGFSEGFTRMWEYYFAYCQAGFKNKHIGNIQALWQKH